MQRPSLLKESMTRRWFTSFPMVFLFTVRANGGGRPLRDPRHGINRSLCSGTCSGLGSIRSTPGTRNSVHVHMTEATVQT